MPRRPPTPCSHPGCSALTAGGPCAAHRGHTERARKRAYEATRPTAAARGYDSRWQKARAGFLAKHPLCECGDCARLGRVRAASVVDHIIPHRGDKALFWDRDNWQAMSKTCHDRKTAREDGRWKRRERTPLDGAA